LSDILLALCSRCVGRAYLYGEDKYAEKSFEHLWLYVIERIHCPRLLKLLSAPIHPMRLCLITIIWYACRWTVQCRGE